MESHIDKEEEPVANETLSLVTIVPPEEHDSPKVLEAKQLELRHFKDYGVYKEVNDLGQARISSGWILTKKTIEGKDKVKARLACHGNQKSVWQSKSNSRTESPTIKRKSIKSFSHNGIAIWMGS